MATRACCARLMASGQRASVGAPRTPPPPVGALSKSVSPSTSPSSSSLPLSSSSRPPPAWVCGSPMGFKAAWRRGGAARANPRTSRSGAHAHARLSGAHARRQRPQTSSSHSAAPLASGARAPDSASGAPCAAAAAASSATSGPHTQRTAAVMHAKLSPSDRSIAQSDASHHHHCTPTQRGGPPRIGTTRVAGGGGGGACAREGCAERRIPNTPKPLPAGGGGGGGGGRAGGAPSTTMAPPYVPGPPPSTASALRRLASSGAGLSSGGAPLGVEGGAPSRVPSRSSKSPYTRSSPIASAAGSSNADLIGSTRTYLPTAPIVRASERSNCECTSTSKSASCVRDGTPRAPDSLKTRTRSFSSRPNGEPCDAPAEPARGAASSAPAGLAANGWSISIDVTRAGAPRSSANQGVRSTAVRAAVALFSLIASVQLEKSGVDDCEHAESGARLTAADARLANASAASALARAARGPERASVSAASTPRPPVRPLVAKRRSLYENTSYQFNTSTSIFGFLREVGCVTFLARSGRSMIIAIRDRNRLTHPPARQPAGARARCARPCACAAAGMIRVCAYRALARLSRRNPSPPLRTPTRRSTRRRSRAR